MKVKRETVTFTADDIVQITAAAWRTFEVIASDFQALVMEGEGRAYMKRAEVIEMVVDANRLSTHGGLDRKLEEKIYAMSRRAQDRMFRKIFTSARYS